MLILLHYSEAPHKLT